MKTTPTKSPYKIEFRWENMSENEILQTIDKFNVPVQKISGKDPDWEKKLLNIIEQDNS